MKTEGLLSRSALFENMPEEHLEALAGITERKSYGRGETVFSEGDPVRGFYIVSSGRIKIFKLSPEGKEQTLHLFGEGEPFGEIPVFSGGRYPASATAHTESRVLFLPRTAFLDLVRKEPSIALNMLAILSRRLRRFAGMIEDLSLREVPGRLAAHLLTLHDRKGAGPSFPLEMPKRELAALLGTIPETLSRIFGKMRQEKLIRLDGSTIEILDRTRLEGIAAGEEKI